LHISKTPLEKKFLSFERADRPKYSKEGNKTTMIMLTRLLPYLYFICLPTIGFASLNTELRQARDLMLTRRYREADIRLDHIQSTRKNFSFHQRESWFHLKGLVSFYLGSHKRAGAYFRRVFQYNPQARISPQWIHDPRVIVLYEQLRRTTPLSTKLIMPRENNSSPRNSQSQAIRRQMSQYRAQRSFTGIVFLSNRPNTRIYVKDLHVGNAGQNISLKPGTYRFTISAPGYSSISRTYGIRPGHRPVIRVELSDQTDRPPRRNRYELPNDAWRHSRTPRKQILVDTRGKTKVYNWMPFGLGQFQNSENTKGVILASFQGFGMTYGTYFYLKAKQAENMLKRAQLDREIVDLPSSGQEGSPNNNTPFPTPPAAGGEAGGGGEAIWSLVPVFSPMNEEQQSYHDEFNKFEAVSRLHHQQMKQQQALGFGVFFVSWVASVIDAYARFDVTERKRRIASVSSNKISTKLFVWNSNQYSLQVKVKL
jgi:hypothetical protein